MKPATNDFLIARRRSVVAKAKAEKLVARKGSIPPDIKLDV